MNYLIGLYSVTYNVTSNECIAGNGMDRYWKEVIQVST